MTVEMQGEMVRILFDKNREFFFNKLETATDSNINENPFIIELELNPGADSQEIQTYELKNEFKESLSKLSLIEIVQILNANDNDDIKTIKKWVTFLGIVMAVQIGVGIIAGIVLFL